MAEEPPDRRPLVLNAKQRAYSRNWYRRNRQKAMATSRKWATEHPERTRAIELASYERNRVARAARLQAHQQANPDKWRTYNHARRARVLGAIGRYTAREWADKRALFGGACAYCGESKKLEPDHKIPLKRGGSNDITNIVPACRSCNARKGVRTASEFLAVA